MFPLVYVLLSAGKYEIFYSSLFINIHLITQPHQLNSIFLLRRQKPTTLIGIKLKCRNLDYNLYRKENENIIRPKQQTAVLSLVPSFLVVDVRRTTLDGICEAERVNILDTTSCTDYMTESWI